MREDNKGTGILAERIYRSRKALGMTQETLAEKLGITPQSVSRWENGQSRPDVDMLPRLAAFFGITIDALFGYKAENLKITQYEKNHQNQKIYSKCAANKLALDVLNFLPPTSPKNILEIGCGEGHNAVFFARNGYLVSAFDVNEAGLEEGRKLAEEVGVNVNFFRADLLTYRLEGNFDIIYAANVMQIVPPNERPHIFEMLQSHTNIGGLNVFNAFVKKDFVKQSPALDDNEYFYKTAELFGYYGSGWKTELIKEIYVEESDKKSYSHCADVLIARKIRE
ncbi:MAG: helix-turn-helix domain-containing protein [Selenomonadaceae bacterium]|nr:helix-turn-helix domain-containing protein [Selenomonadaceae bacterium]